MSAQVFDPTRRPGLAYQHAFDWLAVQLHSAAGPVAALAAQPWHAAELLRRMPDLPLINPPAGTAIVARELGLTRLAQFEPGPAALVALAWVEPLQSDAAELGRIYRLLLPGGRLYVIAGGSLARFLAERRTSPLTEYLGVRGAGRALAGHDLHLEGRVGLHGPGAIAWYLAGALAGRVDRRHWQDRGGHGMRRAFITMRGPAALVCLTAGLNHA